MRRIKILQLLPECHERSHDPSDLAEQIAASFPVDRYEVTTAFISGAPRSSSVTSFSEHRHYFKFSADRPRPGKWTVMRALHDYCRDNEIEVVICHRYKQVAYMLWLNRLLRLRLCIGVSHGFGEYSKLNRRFLTRFLVSRSWSFVGVSDAVRDHLVSLNCGFTTTNTLGVQNAIDVDYLVSSHLSREEARRALGLKHDRVLIGAVGRLVEAKGHIYLIRAFARIAERFPLAELVIIGEGKLRDRLEAEVRALSLVGRVHLVGWRTRAVIYAKAFDIWTMPSVSEGFGLALLEGMSASLPIVASRIPAMRGMISGAGGIAVDPGNVEQLASGLERYLSLSPSERFKVGEKVFEYLVENHRIEDYRKAYLNLVESRLGL